MSVLASALAGALFALGLVLAGMTEPARILRFLDVAGDWDPALAFVMAGAVATYAPLYWFVTRLRRPLLDPQFHLPPRGPLDRKLLAGAALFGVGWGLAGLCPGPALVGLGAGKPEIALFTAAMIVGSLASSWVSRANGSSTRRAARAQDDA